MAVQATALPPLSHVLETILYVKDMEKSSAFYRDVFGLEPMGASARGTSFGIGQSVFLLFQLGMTVEDMHEDGRGTIPGHGPSEQLRKLLLQPSSDGAEPHVLKQHFCFAVQDRTEVEKYQARLMDKGVEILATMNWARGGYSFYFADPDGHVGEVASRGLWPVY